ncbi:hypothetical protein SAMN05216360_105230 [Methylobacterium phyllostachyos]|uniref:Uncharacterized protein n=1 Tax=Methylobacterium phyllostachyos TaxID=582672 RepID=A0A1G9Y9X6_9HYPH|nr:hypothetical protein [Methylobacterium phyllostachyos]SDN05892.1 hypothetical protein SAMN05216360_105230 [Methylobacterium phyllostachyos]
MCPARKPTPARFVANPHVLTAAPWQSFRAANDNMRLDRAAAIVVAIGQASAALAGISGLVAVALMIAR